LGFKGQRSRLGLGLRLTAIYGVGSNSMSLFLVFGWLQKLFAFTFHFKFYIVRYRPLIILFASQHNVVSEAERCKKNCVRVCTDKVLFDIDLSVSHTLKQKWNYLLHKHE